MSGKLPFPLTLSGGEAPEDGGDHLIVVLKGVVVVPRWSATSCSIVGIIVEPHVLELPGKTNAVLHLVFGVLVKRARAVKYLLVLLVVVTLGARLTSGGEDVFWPAAVILARPVSSCSITAAIAMIAAVVGAAVIVTSVIGAIVILVRWSLSAHILVEAHLGFLCIGVLVGGSYHFADTGRRLTVEFGAKLAMVESSDKGGDDFSFRDVGIEFLISEKRQM